MPKISLRMEGLCMRSCLQESGRAQLSWSILTLGSWRWALCLKPTWQNPPVRMMEIVEVPQLCGECAAHGCLGSGCAALCSFSFSMAGPSWHHPIDRVAYLGVLLIERDIFVTHQQHLNSAVVGGHKFGAVISGSCYWLQALLCVLLCALCLHLCAASVVSLW